jgi:hypothetical protein
MTENHCPLIFLNEMNHGAFPWNFLSRHLFQYSVQRGPGSNYFVATNSNPLIGVLLD